MGGAIVCALPFVLLRMAWTKVSEKRLWAGRGPENTAEALIQSWTDRFGVAPDPVFVHAIDEDGAAWIIDHKGNFIVRFGNGREYFIGSDPDESAPVLNAKKRGGRGFDIEDAFAIMLANRSLGHSSVQLPCSMTSGDSTVPRTRLFVRTRFVRCRRSVG